MASSQLHRPCNTRLGERHYEHCAIPIGMHSVKHPRLHASVDIKEFRMGRLAYTPLIRTFPTPSIYIQITPAATNSSQ
jgi:hypothetical protein